MELYSSPEEINNTFMEFWNKSYDEIFLSMAGLADIWEGPTDSGFGMDAGSSTILATKIYNDKIFIAQGGGLQTLLKVVSPNGIEIYDLGSQLTLMTHTAQDVYGSMAVINENEVILGYMYVNLEMLFMAPYGIDLSALWRNPAAKIVPTRISTSSWIVAIRDNYDWRVFITKKESPEDCLPCLSKKENAKDGTSFECREEAYSRSALEISGYKASRASLGAGGASLSVTKMGGFGKMERISRPTPDNKKCLEAIDEYTRIFNKAKISPSDIGSVGQKMSSSCSRVMYLAMLQIVDYKSKTKSLYNTYLKKFMQKEQSSRELLDESKNIVQLISTMLGELKNVRRDSDLLKSIFSDQIWWGPIWFVGNQSKILGLESDENAYSLLNRVKYEDFVDVILTASNGLDSSKSTPLPMGWIIMSGKNQTPIKYGKESMTYFRFPFSVCTSTRPLFSTSNMDFRSICEVETRPDGALVWVWVDKSTLWNKQYIILRCYKVSNDGILSTLDEVVIGYDMSPVDDSAKTVGVSEDSDYWIVRDYYIKDSQSGGIGYVESKVAISSDMQEIYGASASTYYSNCNEMSGAEGSSTGTMKYVEGTLERDWSQLDLDDNKISSLAWGNDGKQYSFVAGYTGYQIHASGEL